MGQTRGRFLVEFMVQFVDLSPRVVEGTAARCRDGVDTAPAAIDVFQGGLQQATPLHAVQQGVQRSRADAVAVTIEFFHHCQSENGFMQCMYQNVNSDQAGKQIALTARLRQGRLRGSAVILISNFDDMIPFSR